MSCEITIFPDTCGISMKVPRPSSLNINCFVCMHHNCNPDDLQANCHTLWQMILAVQYVLLSLACLRTHACFWGKAYSRATSRLRNQFSLKGCSPEPAMVNTVQAWSHMNDDFQFHWRVSLETASFHKILEYSHTAPCARIEPGNFSTTF